MIFKQVREIIEGTKTQTRRVVKDSEYYCDDNQSVYTVTFNDDNMTSKRRLKWQVGRKYAVVPGRAKPQVYYKDTFLNGIQLAHESIATNYDVTWMERCKELSESRTPKQRDGWKHLLELRGFKPLYIEITDIRCEPLHNITNADAIAEGCNGLWNSIDGWNCTLWDTVIQKTAKEEYKSLWESINGIGSWDANPDVWVLEFKAVN